MAEAPLEVEVAPVAVPASLDAPDAAAFMEANGVRNEFEAERVGTDDLRYDPAEILPTWLNPYEPKRMFAARVEGRMVGRGVYELRADASSTTCWFSMDVLRGYRGRGVEDALHERLLACARADGKRSVNLYVFHGAGGAGERVPASTGAGSVPIDDSTRFLLANGYSLGQVERISRLPLPAAPRALEGRRDEAAAQAGPDYRVVRWTGRTPDRWVAGVAELNTRMNTDAPTGDMPEDEDPWDEDRVRVDDALQESSGRTLLVTAVEHRPSGRLVAFSELSVPAEPHRPANQEDTLVLAEHRGRRLGMLVKAENLLALHERADVPPSVITFNAEENRHMLHVNEALGFAAIGYEGGWRRDLP